MSEQPKDVRRTVLLPDGYAGHTVAFYVEPLEVDGHLVKLGCAEAGREALIKWARAPEVALAERMQNGETVKEKNPAAQETKNTSSSEPTLATSRRGPLIATRKSDETGICFRHFAPGGCKPFWQHVDTNDKGREAAVGPHYGTKEELLADHANYLGRAGWLHEERKQSGEVGKHDWCVGNQCEDGVPAFVDDRPLAYRATAALARSLALEIIADLQADGDYRLNDRPQGFMPPKRQLSGELGDLAGAVVLNGKFADFKLIAQKALGVESDLVNVHGRKGSCIGAIRSADVSAFVAGDASVLAPEPGWRSKWSSELIDLCGLDRHLTGQSASQAGNSHGPAATTPDGVELVATGRHVGRISQVTEQFAIQNCGRGKTVAHALGRFDVSPKAGELLDVQYKSGKAVVAEPAQSLARE